VSYWVYQGSDGMLKLSDASAALEVIKNFGVVFHRLEDGSEYSLTIDPEDPGALYTMGEEGEWLPAFSGDEQGALRHARWLLTNEPDAPRSNDIEPGSEGQLARRHALETLNKAMRSSTRVERVQLAAMLVLHVIAYLALAWSLPLSWLWESITGKGGDHE